MPQAVLSVKNMEIPDKSLKTTVIKTARVILLALSVLLALYLILLPLYPLARFKFFPPAPLPEAPVSDGEQVAATAPATSSAATTTASSTAVKAAPRKTEIKDRIIIPKIGVNAPIVESRNDQYALDRGAWLLPDTSTPDKGGNTVISGHRFKYLPPNNLTFYLLDKLATGDKIEVKWRGKDYRYTVEMIKIVPAEDTTILAPNDEARLTVFTCDPIFSTKNRLVVMAKLTE